MIEYVIHVDADCGEIEVVSFTAESVLSLNLRPSPPDYLPKKNKGPVSIF
jgi:hypothetical protein